MPEEIEYPRCVVVRQTLRLLARTMLPLLAGVQITGKENLPWNRSLIVVGKHTAAMEVVLSCYAQTPILPNGFGSRTQPTPSYEEIDSSAL